MPLPDVLGALCGDGANNNKSVIEKLQGTIVTTATRQGNNDSSGTFVGEPVGGSPGRPGVCSPPPLVVLAGRVRRVTVPGNQLPCSQGILLIRGSVARCSVTTPAATGWSLLGEVVLK